MTFIIHIERKNGWPHNTLVFVFWFLIFLASLVTLRSKLLFKFYTVRIKNLQNLSKIKLLNILTLLKKSKDLSVIQLKINKLTDLDLANFFVTFILIVFSLILSTISERTLKLDNSGNDRKSPHQNSPLLSMLTFWWVNRLISEGYKRDLTRNDLWELDDAEKTDTATRKLETVWNPKASKYVLIKNILFN